MSAAQPRRSSAARTCSGEGHRPMRRKATTKMTTPAIASMTRHGANFCVETRNCASAGFSRTKSSVPLRMCSTTAASDGFTAPSSTPFITMNQPMTTRASSNDHPATARRLPNTTTTGTSDQLAQNSASAPCTRKSRRYCIATVAEARSWTPRSRR
jgi:hypothetical protein